MTFDQAQNTRLGQRGAVEDTGIQLVTLTTLPEIAYRGQLVYCLDVDEFRVFDGVAWQVPTASASAGGQTFVSDTEPVADNTGDLWMRTTDYVLHVWDGTQWQEVQDPTADAAATQAGQAYDDAQQALGMIATLQTDVDGKTTTFYGPTEPLEWVENDLWFNTATNRLYRRGPGTENYLQEIVDQEIIDATSDIGELGGLVDQKVSTYYVETYADLEAMIPAMGPEDEGDLAYVADEDNRAYMWRSGAWEELTIGSGAIAPGVVEGITLSADRIKAGTLTETIELQGTLIAYGASGESVSMGGEGFTVRGPDSEDNDIYVDFPTDGAKPRIISGSLSATTLTVEEGGSINNSMSVEPGAQLLLAGKVSKPKSALALGSTWESVAHANPTGGYASTVTPSTATKGHDGEIYVAARNVETYLNSVEQVGIWRSDLPPVDRPIAGMTGWDPQLYICSSSTHHGVTNRSSETGKWYHGANGVYYSPTHDRYYILVHYQVTGGINLELLVYDTTWTLVQRKTTDMVVGTPTVDTQPVLGWDHVSNRPMVACWDSNQERIEVRGYNLNGDGTFSGTYGDWASAVEGPYAKNLGFISKGAFDFGANKYVVRAQEWSSNAKNFRVYPEANGSLQDADMSWPSAFSTGIVGGWWDTTESRFKALSTDFRLATYETYAFTQAGTAWKFAYTWYDTDVTNGNKETDLSAVSNWTAVKRARLQVTANPTPPGAGVDAPNAWRLYRAVGAGAYSRWKTISAPTTSYVLKSTDVPETGAPPASNSFPNVTNPGRIDSATGLSYWAGDDTAKFQSLILESATDAGPGANNMPPLRIGNIAGVHLRVDGNEIQAMTSNTANDVGGLMLQQSGGDVNMNGASRVLIGGKAITGWNWNTGSFTTNSSSMITIPHGLTVTPSFAMAMNFSFVNYRVVGSDRTSTNIIFQVRNETGTPVGNGVTVQVGWFCVG